MNKTLDISVFVPSLRGGGAERVMVALANGYASRGHRVDLVLAQVEGPYLTHVDEAVRLVDLRCTRVIKAVYPLSKYFRRRNVDVVMSAMPHANIAAFLALNLSGRRRGCRLLVSERNHFSSAESSSRFSALRLAIRLSYQRTDAVVAISQGVAEDISEVTGLPRNRIAVVYNPLLVKRSNYNLAVEPPHQWLQDQDSQHPTLVTAGRLAVQKDFPTLLRAVAIVRTQRPVRLLILGEGKMRSTLSALAVDLGLSNAVDFVGFVERPEHFFEYADAFVLSSRHEGFGNVIVEAMAAGAPIISTDCPSGPGEILEGGRWGRLVPVADPHKLAEAIIATLDDPSPPDVKRRAADFTLDSTLDGYLHAAGFS